jgi:hypothetical protein
MLVWCERVLIFGNAALIVALVISGFYGRHIRAVLTNYATLLSQMDREDEAAALKNRT